jgi:nucleotide-binding universal stress UspA family protein
MFDFPKRIMVATDGSEAATLAVEAASEIADGTGSELYLVHVWPDLPPVGRIGPTGPIADDFVREHQQEAEEFSRRQAWRAESAGATVAEKHLRVRRPAEEIAALADEVGADLVVLGSRQMGTLKRLVLGSTPQEVVRKAARPVLVVRGGWPPSRVVVGDDLSEEAGRAHRDYRRDLRGARAPDDGLPAKQHVHKLRREPPSGPRNGARDRANVAGMGGRNRSRAGKDTTNRGGGPETPRRRAPRGFPRR